jgi:ATP-binding cassette subfamily B protein
MTSSETAAELRLFGLGDFFLNLYKTTRKRLRSEHLRLLREQSVAEAGAAVFALLAAAGCVAWMGLKTLEGLLTLGELALFYAAFRQGQQMMRSLLSNAGDIYRNVIFLGDLFEFLGLESKIKDSPNPVQLPSVLQKGIKFQDVTFAYPGSERVVVENFNLTMKAGEMVAVVGPNGSGKSTIMRLLCRLYDPRSGKIEFDGRDLKDYRVEEVRKAITVLFQKPVQYNLTTAKNIELGDLESGPTDAQVKQAAESAGLAGIVAKLPNGYETLLGKWFEGGTELSVGEWQRVALARALLRQSPIVILDEPTSAMDSWAEADWMGRLRQAVKGRTTMIITHRFTTAMRADIIHVMRHGRIVESGSHDELLDKDGYYAESWKKQMSDDACTPSS